MRIIFMYGLPASGKTTYARKLMDSIRNKYNPFLLISADLVREQLYGSQDAYGDPEEVFRAIVAIMEYCIVSNVSFIYDGVNMRKDWRKDFLDIFEKYDNRIDSKTIIKMSTPKKTCIDRFFKRDRKIPFSSVEKYFTMPEEPPTYDEGWDMIDSV